MNDLNGGFKSLYVSTMTIARLKTRLRDTAMTNDRLEVEGHGETTLRQGRHIRIIHLHNRFLMGHK